MSQQTQNSIKANIKIVKPKPAITAKPNNGGGLQCIPTDVP